MIVMVAVLINIIGAIVLKEMSLRPDLPSVWITFGIVLVIGLNGLRFLIWAQAHSRYPLSTTFPFTSLFFPMLLLVSYYYGDPLPWTKWLGTALITVGVFRLALKTKS
jgi:multidrug transporter EmrE-like cation transporter